MTQTGKCDVCRQRKIACDEVHPTCGRCTRGKRTCTYAHGRTVRFVADRKGKARHPSNANAPMAASVPWRLSVSAYRSKFTRTGGAGGGTFSTFVLVTEKRNHLAQRHQALNQVEAVWQIPPQVPVSHTLARWVHLMNRTIQGYGIREVIDGWKRSIPLLIGQCDTLAAASDAYISVWNSREHPSTENTAAVHGAYTRALRCTRRAIALTAATPDAGGKACDSLLFSVILLYFVEAFLRRRASKAKSFHISGIVQLITLASRGGTRCNEAVASCLTMYAYTEYHAAIPDRRLSACDTPAWRAALHERFPLHRGRPCSDLTTVHCHLISRYVKLPRLAVLTRTAMQCPGNSNLWHDAIVLAADLFDNDVQEYWEVHVVGTGLVKTVKTAECPPMDMFEYASSQIFEVYILYWTTQSVLCALIQSLLSHPTAFKTDIGTTTSSILQRITRPAVEASARWTAHSIVSSTDFGFTSPTPMRINTLRMHMQVQLAFSYFCQVEKQSHVRRYIGEELYARRMKRKCFDVLCAIFEYWAPDSRMSYEGLENNAESLLYCGGASSDYVFADGYLEYPPEPSETVAFKN